MKDLVLNDKMAADYILQSINDNFFGGEMIPVIVNFTPIKGSYGHFHASIYVRAGFENNEKTEEAHEINLSPCNYSDLLSVVVTLFHESIHLANFVEGVRDVGHGQRHNKAFYNKCMEHGLYVEKINHRVNYDTPADLEKQNEKFKLWYKQLVKELKEKFGDKGFDDLFTFRYKPRNKNKASTDDGISNKFMCIDTGDTFTLPKKAVKKLLARFSGNEESMIDSMLSPYTGGSVVIHKK